MPKRLIRLTILILLLIPSFSFLLHRGIYWNMHDDMQLIRQLDMEKCLKDGQIPCRWTPDLGYGYGYPLFNFYPPLPYYVGQIFRTLTFSFTETVKYTAVLQFLTAALAMYLLASDLFGPLAGILSALFYTYAPYHAVNIYVRGAMNEAWASVFFPLIFYFSKKYLQTLNIKNLLFFALCFSFLLQSHNPMALTFSPVLALWIFYWLIFYKQLSRLPKLVLNFSLFSFLSLGITAYYTLPVIIESKLVQIESMFQNYYHYTLHFVSLRQLFVSNFWGDGPSLWGTGDGMSFSIGYLHWIIPLVSLVVIVTTTIRQKKINRQHLLLIVLFLAGLFTTFLAHERSTFIWQLLPPIQKIQFPWRFLNIVVFIFSLSAGGSLILLNRFKPHWKIIAFTLITVGLFILNAKYFTPVTHGPVTDDQKFSGIAWRNQVTGGIYDYLPKTAPTAPRSPAKEYVDSMVPESTKFTITGAKKGTDWQLFNLNLDSPATVNLSTLYFPGFRLTVDNATQPIAPDRELGRISFPLSAGPHQLYLKFYNTPVRTIGNYLTLLSAGIFIFLLFKWKNPKYTS